MHIPKKYTVRKNAQCKVAHLTSAHARYDTRIFLKQCTSLAQNGYDTYLIVADGKGHDEKNRVQIIDVGASKGRLDRMRNAVNRVYKAAILLDADLYQLHDPELIPIGIRLKRRGKKVVFDSHEDVAKQMLSKPYLTPFLLWCISKLYSVYENYACRKLDGIITATPSIMHKFLPVNRNTVNVNNYPLPNELESDGSWSSKNKEICYVGGISSIRGINEVIEAMEDIRSEIRLNLVGTFDEASTRTKVANKKGWQKVNELGFLNRPQVKAVLGRSIAGIVTFGPYPNHIEAQPNKIFEYMSASIPVIASHFPLWQEIIQGANCGICVDPECSSQIARALDWIVENPEEAATMGENGYKAVHEKYNWTIEEEKLLDFYDAMKG